MGIDLQLTAHVDDENDIEWGKHLHASQRMLARTIPHPQKAFEACPECSRSGRVGLILHYFARDHNDPSQLIGVTLCTQPQCTVALVVLTHDDDAPEA